MSDRAQRAARERSPRASSRPTTSAASTASRWTRRPTTSSAAPSPACSPSCAASRPPSCGSASAATCACRRRRWRPRSATGSSPRAPAVLDVGMVGTEMLYFAVGARDLDGGAMITASHNPKAYTGVKLVREGALALSGETGITRIRDLIEAGLGDAPGGGSVSELEIYDRVPRRGRWASSTPTSIKPMKVVVDGGNGMAGAMVGPLLERLPIELIATYWEPGRQLPRPRAEPAAAREPRSSSSTGSRPRAPTSGSPGTATPTAASSSTTTASSSTATSSPRCSRSWCSPRSRAPTSSTTCAPAARSPTRSPLTAAPPTSTGSATRS